MAVLFYILQKPPEAALVKDEQFGRVAQRESSGMNIHVSRFNSGPYHQ